MVIGAPRCERGNATRTRREMADSCRSRLKVPHSGSDGRPSNIGESSIPTDTRLFAPLVKLHNVLFADYVPAAKRRRVTLKKACVHD